MRFGWAIHLFLVGNLLAGCAHNAEQERAEAQRLAEEKAAQEAAEKAKAEAKRQEALEADLFGPPKSWEDVAGKYEFECPVPNYTLEQPHAVKVGAHQFWIHGALLEKEGDSDRKEWRIGVLGAIKDATEPTQKNLKKAAEIFAKQGVDFVIVNGDLADQFDDLKGVFDLLASNFDIPMLVFPGNVDPVNGFNRNFMRVSPEHPNIFNMMWHHHLKWGKLHLFVVPGYHNKDFSQPGACIYRDKHIELLDELMTDSKNMGEFYALAAHGPPRGEGRYDLDYAAGGGNVGDERLAELISKHNVRLGLFSHILEAGANAKTSMDKASKFTFPMKSHVENFYVNVGASSGMPWDLNNGRLSQGMAAVVHIHLEQGIKTDLIRF
tara:strand:- start:1425 stop:2564 length:1140 start_codon:yes stop_codon:yes gene_type:complete